MFYFSTVEEFAGLREAVRKKLMEMPVIGVDPFFVAINEAVNNAIFHGNKQDKNKKVHLSIVRLPGEVRAIIRDEGQGFAPTQTSPEAGLQENGRGIEIIGHCVDHYYFNLEPSEMVLIKKDAS
jgi:serine/threonine-protein kinase RsbW